MLFVISGSALFFVGSGIGLLLRWSETSGNCMLSWAVLWEESLREEWLWEEVFPALTEDVAKVRLSSRLSRYSLKWRRIFPHTPTERGVLLSRSFDVLVFAI